MTMTGSRSASGERAAPVAKSKWTATPAIHGRRGPVTPLAVKIVLVVVMLNLLVAAMMLMKLRAPHLGEPGAGRGADVIALRPFSLRPEQQNPTVHSSTRRCLAALAAVLRRLPEFL